LLLEIEIKWVELEDLSKVENLIYMLLFSLSRMMTE